MAGALPVELAENLLPRRYQEEIFMRAQEGNIIAALDTGSGKTFISILLMKWIAARYTGDKKVVVFLVPKVALVEQQADFIVKQTPLRVSRYYGAMAIDMSDRSKWKLEFENSDVLVMTAQIFLNIITHSHWSIEKVSLMVFDECHHTRKNHAYNGIMREYFQAPAGHRPKIFGMTASPIWNPKDAAESLATLERNMNAKVIAVRDHAQELSNHLPRPTELIVEYPPPCDIYPTYPTPFLRSRLRELDLPTEWEIPWDKIEARYEVTWQCLGPFGAELYLYLDMKQRIVQLFAQAQEASTDAFLHDFAGWDLDMMQAATSMPPSPELVKLDILLSKYQLLFVDSEHAFDVGREWCTPQVLALVDVLLKHYTDSFQGIVFVEQRHVALSLSRLLPRLPELKGRIKSAELVGHGGTTAAKAQLKGMAIANQQDVVKLFRDGEINLLIATSVAEEGLDFPACDLVIRFDPIQHMVGYVQSRGRARHKSSTFVVMIQQGNAESIFRYRSFAESEPQLKEFYQQHNKSVRVQEDEEPEEGEIEFEDPADLAERERYVVPSTGAILTYNSAVSLLNHLCTLIPRDKYTPSQLPAYIGDFDMELQLPSALPLPPENLVFEGPPRRSKKEAKRAVAFVAVKRLHALGVFDDYLMPAKSMHGGSSEDADGREIPDTKGVPEMMTIAVRDPWTMGRNLWLHLVYIDDKPLAGLITGTSLPDVTLGWAGLRIRLGLGARVVFEAEQKHRGLLERFTRTAVWWTVTGRPISLPMSCYVVPLTSALKPDYDVMEECDTSTTGTYDWSGVTDAHCGHILCMNSKEYGRPLLLTRIRWDMTPMSHPPAGTRESAHATYLDWYISKYTRKGVPPEIREDSPLIEVRPVPRQMSGHYSLGEDSTHWDDAVGATVANSFLLPMCMCRWMPIPEALWRTMRYIPRLMRRVTDVYRARCLKSELHLPRIPDDLLVEACTLPSANAGFSNQRFETLGDAVLKLGIVVHLFNRFPHRHEGQLDVLRRSSGSNRTLMARALEAGLEQFLNCETVSLRTWRYTLAEGNSDLDGAPADRFAWRDYPRRSLQDCMEACLGASYVAGGMEFALRTASALGMALGGPTPWLVRYRHACEKTPASALFADLQEQLGYVFRRGELLVEAITHPSFRSTVGSSYQRLEFMGDALIDLVVMDYLYNKFPQANSGQLSWARSRTVCSPALALVAVKRLKLHKLLLVNNVELSTAIGRYVPVLEEISEEDMIKNGWKHDPPKALSDVFESVLGAVLVDTQYNLDKTIGVVQHVMWEMLETLSPDLPRDPVSQLMVWAAKAGCRQISFSKTQSTPGSTRNDRISVVVHGMVVAGPIGAGNISLAKGLVAERALEILGTQSADKSLAALCSCADAMKMDMCAEAAETAEEAEKPPNDETVLGFAALAQQKLLESAAAMTTLDERHGNEDAAEDAAVEAMLRGRGVQ